MISQRAWFLKIFLLTHWHSVGVTKMQRPPRRTEWSSILEILKDDRHSLIDIPEQVIQNVGINPQEVSENNPAAVSTQSSASYEYCNHVSLIGSVGACGRQEDVD